METLTFILATLLSASGLVAGSIVSWMAEEELQPGKKIFILLKRFIFPLTVGLTAFFAYGNFYLFIAVVAAAITLQFVFTKLNLLIIYSIFSVFQFIAGTTNEALMISSTLIFLYGFPVAAIFFAEKTKIDYNRHEETSMRFNQFIRHLGTIIFPGVMFSILAVVFWILF